MYGLNESLPELGFLALTGAFFVWIAQVAGSYFDRFFGGNKATPVSRLLLGYLLISAVFSLIFFKFKTVYLPIGLVLAILIFWVMKSGTAGFKLKTRAHLVPVFFFLVFFLFRVALMTNPETGLFDVFLTDDYVYTSTIAYMFYTGEENMAFVVSQKLIGTDTGYYTYHYFTFSGCLVLKFLTRLNSSLLFHFFLIPFFQAFGTTGLFSIFRSYKMPSLLSVLLSLMLISTLRYNVWDNLLTSVLPWFKNGYWFQDFFGRQFLASGFNIKFCIAIGILSLIFIYMNEIRVISKSFFLIFINPLFILLAALVHLRLLVFDRRSEWRFSLGFLGLFGLFTWAMKAISPKLNGQDVWISFLRIWNQGPKFWFFSAFGEFINNQLNLLIFPLLLILIYRKSWSERSTAAGFILFPFLQSLIGKTLFFPAYQVLLVVMVLWVLYQNRTNVRLIFLVCSVLILTATLSFSYVIPELDQAFLFIIYPGVMILSAYILSRVLWKNPVQILVAIGLCCMNFSLNYSDIRYQSRKLAESKQFYQNLRQKLPVQGSLSVHGVLNSDARFLYWGRYFAGEEISFLDDHYLPILLKVRQETDASLHNFSYVKAFFPKTLLDTTGIHNPQEEFVKKYRVNPVIVKHKDLHLFPWVQKLAIDSLDNPAKSQRIYFIP